ncbi:TRAP transporter large permease [Comamonas thiooxydans]|uniref:TRAP transporter large permease n=1 Tax=Comamonas thiooxydans TaxID=363952 RepID=UPI002113DE5C|nr:TRAP transporter large permease subunit [Comamonas thiooxydans]UUE92221.1 TRAP transporter large permease subunit [Comamonas thiooxydans]
MKMRKELWFGFSIMALVVLSAIVLLLGVENITNGHLGLLMLSLVVVAIMLGFPTAFTLMGMGMIFTWLAYERDTTRTLDLMVQSAYKSMTNDVLIAIPLFVFMGYLVLSARDDAMVEGEQFEIQPIGMESGSSSSSGTGLAEPPIEGGLQEPPTEGGLQEPPGSESSAPVAATAPTEPETGSNAPGVPAASQAETQPAPTWWWIGFALLGTCTALFYLFLSFARLEIFKMLLGSFFPLVVLILTVLGSIVFGLATPTEAAAMGALGGFVLAAAYKRLSIDVVKESVYLTAKTSAMVCWLFVGSAIFSAAFALLGGQELIERWVLSMNLSKIEFMILSQVVIFLLGWPLEWTEIIVIFMPIFIPLLNHFGVDPLFFGLLVALNLQTAFLSPPVAMSAFYLKGVAPPSVTLNQIFVGMMPFMGIQILAIVLLYIWPQIGLWLPQLLYK